MYFETLSYLQPPSTAMSSKTLWPFFHCGQLQNSVHYKAYCKGCVSYHLIQAKALEEVDDFDFLDPTEKLLKDKKDFKVGTPYLFWSTPKLSTNRLKQRQH